MEYEKLLIGFGWWDGGDEEKFPRFLLVAEEAEGEDEIVADGVSGRMRKHLEASAQRVTKHVDEQVASLRADVGSKLGELKHLLGGQKPAGQ